MESSPRSWAEIMAFRIANVSAIRGDVTDHAVAEKEVIDPAISKIHSSPAFSVVEFQAASVYMCIWSVRGWGSKFLLGCGGDGLG